MTSRHALLLSAALFAPSSLLLACGSSIEVDGDGGGTTTTTTGTGNAGTGGTSTGSTGGTGGTSTGGTGGTGGFTGGSGGTTGTGGSVACAGLGTEVDCLGAYPSCVPVYDDKCCPSCDPIGGCADCIDVRFHHCAPTAQACGPNETSCGLTPDWACAGGKADCAIDPGGSIEPCHTVAGCTATYCPANAFCETDPVCTPVTKGTCTAVCAAVPPECPPGLIAQSDGGCYTGGCIDAAICGFAL